MEPEIPFILKSGGKAKTELLEMVDKSFKVSNLIKLMEALVSRRSGETFNTHVDVSRRRGIVDVYGRK